MNTIEAYCSFLKAIELGHTEAIYSIECGGDCSLCCARIACEYIRDDVDRISPREDWDDVAKRFFSTIDQSLPLSHYQQHYPEYFI